MQSHSFSRPTMAHPTWCSLPRPWVQPPTAWNLFLEMRPPPPPCHPIYMPGLCPRAGLHTFPSSLHLSKSSPLVKIQPVSCMPCFIRNPAHTESSLLWPLTAHTLALYIIDTQTWKKHIEVVPHWMLYGKHSYSLSNRWPQTSILSTSIFQITKFSIYKYIY